MEHLSQTKYGIFKLAVPTATDLTFLIHKKKQAALMEHKLRSENSRYLINKEDWVYTKPCFRILQERLKVADDSIL